ncbi:MULTISPECIES: hypothetical protein [unclassified Nocardioides]|uniref:hypothetical protein n=1 Tax=unclassified Nocardioides TaxID=2615069 RepID=UPI00361840D6
MSADKSLTEGFVVANEFAVVSLRKVHTRNGERLEIRSLGHDQSVLLDAIALEALTWSNPLEVGQGLETPFGPDPSDPVQNRHGVPTPTPPIQEEDQ